MERAFRSLDPKDHQGLQRAFDERLMRPLDPKDVQDRIRSDSFQFAKYFPCMVEARHEEQGADVDADTYTDSERDE